jgi:hypothetical protein
MYRFASVGAVMVSFGRGLQKTSQVICLVITITYDAIFGGGAGSRTLVQTLFDANVYADRLTMVLSSR